MSYKKQQKQSGNTKKKVKKKTTRKTTKSKKQKQEKNEKRKCCIQIKRKMLEIQSSFREDCCEIEVLFERNNLDEGKHKTGKCVLHVNYSL